MERAADGRRRWATSARNDGAVADGFWCGRKRTKRALAGWWLLMAGWLVWWTVCAVVAAVPAEFCAGNRCAVRWPVEGLRMRLDDTK